MITQADIDNARDPFTKGHLEQLYKIQFQPILVSTSSTQSPSLSNFQPKFIDFVPADMGPGVIAYYNSHYFLDLPSTQVLALLVGGSVAQIQLFPTGGFYPPPLQNAIKMPNGIICNAGMLADIFTHGYPKESIDFFLKLNLGEAYKPIW